MFSARRIVMAAMGVSLAACASGKGATPAGAVSAAPSAATPAAAPQVRARSNVITEQEIAALGSSVQTAMQVIERLRPRMLQVRTGQGSNTASSGTNASGPAAEGLMVYFDAQPMPYGLQSLRDLMVTQIREIRYLSASDATTLFGTGNTVGAIQVISKR